MGTRRQRTTRWSGTRRSLLVSTGAALSLFVPTSCVAQASGATAPSMGQSTSSASPLPTREQPKGEVLDQVVAVVNADLVLESDVDEERRFIAFQPFRDQSKPYSRSQAIARLVDRTLILQQAKLQAGEPVTEADVDAQLTALRKDIPACKQFDCATDAGWEKFVAAQGFTMAELRDRWRERMQVLRFIELRFRMGIRISPEEIKTYYEKTLLPEYARQKAAPPKLAAISDRIQEILLQQQVSALLVDWLASLKAQGTVRMAKPGEVEP